MSQIATADWSALLEHADAIDFSHGPNRRRRGRPIASSIWAITTGRRTRELAINDSFETSELAYLVTLTRRAVRDCQVLSPDMLDDVIVRRLGSGMAGRASGRSRRRSEPLTNRTNA